MTEPKWADYPDEKLLKLKVCELGLKIEGSELEACVAELYNELEAKGLVFRPPCYLADEWFCPDEEPVIGIPFFLAHARLKKLEKKMVLEVEGGTKEQCIKLLRHETGHAINYAYRLYKSRTWRKLFGSFSEEYPDTYVPRPYSKKYVRHLDNCYAQYHPDEDFAETFAVWLSPDRDWRRDYRNWKGALEKLQYVDGVMKKIGCEPPPVTAYKKYFAAENLKQTLEYYYLKKKKAYAEELPGFFDPDLKRIFRETQAEPVESADVFMKRHRRTIVGSVSLWTGKNKYLINNVLKNLINSAKELGLKRSTNEEQALLELTTYINTLVMNYLFTGRFKPCP